MGFHEWQLSAEKSWKIIVCLTCKRCTTLEAFLLQRHRFPWFQVFQCAAWKHATQETVWFAMIHHIFTQKTKGYSGYSLWRPLKGLFHSQQEAKATALKVFEKKCVWLSKPLALPKELAELSASESSMAFPGSKRDINRLGFVVGLANYNKVTIRYNSYVDAKYYSSCQLASLMLLGTDE